MFMKSEPIQTEGEAAVDAKGAHASEHFWRAYRPPMRGELHGRCNNALCSGVGARWYNIASAQYYCEECARRINQKCRQLGGRELCERHV
jgi:hypothetical protein